jgi:rifampicin phosphotransferase
VTIHRLSDLSRNDLRTAGGKGANLGEMTKLGLPVPPGFVVSAGAYGEQAKRWGVAERLGPHLAAADWEAVSAAASALIEGGALSPDLEAAIREAYRDLGASRVAVRSSATAEDLADASFAGQQETFLNVEGDLDLLASIRRCWASLWSPRALHYRHVRQIDHLSVEIAVVVQQMVPADSAGVLFTVDPVAQRADQLLLEAAPGLGEAVVSGRATGDIYRVRREPFSGSDGNAKGGAPGSPLPGAGDLRIVDRENREAQRPAITDAHALEVCRFGLSLEGHFGCPQDVEFAIADGRVFLLQSRPITTLGAAEIEPIPPLPELDFLQRKSAAVNQDRYPIAPKPLDQWVHMAVLPAIANVMRLLGFDVSEADTRAVSQELWREAVLTPQSRPTLRILGAPGVVARALRHDWLSWWEVERERLIAVSRPADLTVMTDEELLLRVDWTIETWSSTLLKRFEALPGLIATALLNVPITLAVGKKRTPTVLADLLANLGTKTSEANHALFKLAQRALSAGPAVTDPVRSGQTERLRDSEAGRAYLAAVEDFLAEHGHRESVCLYVSAPTWRHDPPHVFRLIRGFMGVTSIPEETGAERYRAAASEVESKLSAVPGLSRAFRATLKRVRAIHKFREDSHYDFSRPLMALQALAAEIGRRLHERGHLESPGDVLYLTDPEVRSWLMGGAPPRDEAARHIKRRRATYQVVNGRWQRRRFAGASSASASAGDELRGVGASPGVARGPARIVRDEGQFDRLQPGEILVCSYTNPSWTPLFAYAAGVVTDTGGATSHAAIVAREYGIPAVMGARGATERILDGQEILIDGAEGRVVLNVMGSN